MAVTIERRAAPLGAVEVRQDDDALHFSGHGAVFGEVTTIGNYFREQVDSGAFKKTIKDGADVRLLYNHEPDSVMARTKAGTLRLAEDKRGLLTKADLDPDDFDVKRIAPKMERGDLDQMSFAFRVIVDEWDDEPDDGGLPIRTIKEARLYDVSVVTYPAYEGTDAELNSEARDVFAAHMGVDPAELKDSPPDEGEREEGTPRTEEPAPVSDDSEPRHSLPLGLATRRNALAKRKYLSP